MPFKKIHPEKRSEPIIRQIEDMVLRGILRTVTDYPQSVSYLYN